MQRQTNRNRRRGWAAAWGALVLVGVVAMTGGCAGTDRLATQAPYADPATNPALRAAPRGEGNWWDPRHEAVLERVRQGDVGMVMLGDSITHRLERHPDLWEQYFAPRGAVNMGFDGDGTQQVLWRIQHGCLDGIQPRLAWVLIGSNNCGEGYTAEQVADGIIAVCRAVREKLPRTPILLIGVLPRGEHPDPIREKLARASELAARIADERTIFYRNVNDVLFAPGEVITPEIMYDYVHPTHAGYAAMLAALEPTIASICD